MMQIKDRKIEDVLILELEGRLDAATSGDFEKKIAGWIEAKDLKIIVDLSQLNYISSSGLRVFLVAAKKIGSAGGKIFLASLKPEVREVFDISGFSTIFQIFPSQEEAFRNLQM